MILAGGQATSEKGEALKEYMTGVCKKRHVLDFFRGLIRESGLSGR